MSDWISTWLMAVTVMTGGAAAGFWVANQRRRSDEDGTGPEVDLEELQVLKESRIQQLRELKGNRDKIPDEEYATQRGSLERAAADILRQIDEAVAALKKASRKKGKEPRTFWQRSPQLKGILLGAGAVGLVWLIYPAFVRAPPPPTTSAAPRTHAAGAEPSADGPAAAELEVIMKRVHDDPNDIEAIKRGGAIFLTQGRLDAATMMVQRAHALAPQDPEVRLQYATVQAMGGETDAAMATAEALIADAPGLADAWYLHGMIAMRSGNTDLARKSFGKFMELAPEGPKKDRVRAILSGGQ